MCVYIYIYIYISPNIISVASVAGIPSQTVHEPPFADIIAAPFQKPFRSPLVPRYRFQKVYRWHARRSMKIVGVYGKRYTVRGRSTPPSKHCLGPPLRTFMPAWLLASSGLLNSTKWKLPLDQ